MFRLKLNLDRLLSISNFPQLGFYNCINIENCSIEGITSFETIVFNSAGLSPVLVGSYKVGETSYGLLKMGNEDILSISDTEDYIIFDIDLPENYLLQQTIFYYIQIGVIDVLPLEDSDYISLVLFLQNSENDKLDKVLTTTGLMNGLFNHAIGYKNINIDVTGYEFEFNYVYIPKFERYYYVDSIELVASNITRLHLKEDVLMTWKELIKEQKAFVTRYENSTSKELVDVRYPLEDKMSYASVGVSNTPASSSLVNCHLDYDITANDLNIYNILILTQSTKVEGTYIRNLAPTGSGLPDISAKLNGREHVNFIRMRDLFYFANAYRSDDAVSSFIYSVLWLPFDATETFKLSETQGAIFVRDKYIDEYGNYVNWDSSDNPLLAKRPNRTECATSPYIIIKDFTYVVPNVYFNDREPYTNYEFYIPFVGWVKVESQKFINKRILIYYTIDINSGITTAYIYNYTDKYVIWSGNCQLGLKINLSNTNTAENIKQKQSNDLNMILGLVSSALSIGVGVVTENPLAFAGGVMSAEKTIANAVNSNNKIFERAQITYGTSDGALYSNIEVKLRKSYHVPISIDISTYKHLQGLPYNNYLSTLSSLSGYVEIGEIHFDPKGEKIYQDEIVEITDLLQKGCIF